MKILAEFNGERVYLVNIRENGLVDIIKTKYDEKTEKDTGSLMLVNKKDVAIVDADYLIDSLQEHIRQINRDAKKKKDEELTPEEKKALKNLTSSIAPSTRAKKEIY